MQDMKLDGNAAAGDLEQIFAFEVTTAVGTCAHCGAVGAVGGTNVYAQAPGIVVRCPACHGVLIRLAHDGESRYWLEMTGVRSLEVRL
jgi:Zn finger protein HypA/HybF involved in hydrogenase expression